MDTPDVSKKFIIPNSFIKSVALQIRADYDMENNPYPSPEDSNDKEEKGKQKKHESDTFIGREQHQAKFLKFLQSRSKKGIFLVTGYRGMGKTSFVNYVIKKYKDKQGNAKKIITVHLTLAQVNPKEIDILRLMVTSIKDEYKKYNGENKKYKIKNGVKIPDPIAKVKESFSSLQNRMIAVIFCAIVAITIMLKSAVVGDIYKDGIWSHLFSFSLLFVLGIICMDYFSKYFSLKKKINDEGKEDSPQNRINKLFERCYSIISEENNNGDEINFQGLNTKLSGNNEKRTKQYAVATTKEIEYELHQFLKETGEELEFIFIFDELDKVEPTIGSPYFYNDVDIKETADSYETKIRDRKQAVISIIAALKNFFTTANARFIFIAGREMFDASLADVADRQSSISSIFTYIFNIESFLKEKNLNEPDHTKNNASLSYAIEEHLKKIIFPKEDADTADSLFNIIKKKYKDSKPPAEYSKLYFILQNFVTYLSYRTNGSPKKLIKEIHEFIRVEKGKDSFDKHGDQTTIFPSDEKESNLYIYFNYNNQYRIGFISYLYRPFLIKHGRSYKFYSDNIIQSTPYLFDHLLKFHAFAFSQSNLELIPEMLSSNKTPGLRNHIKQIIDHLSANHLREIEIGLFNYKFFSRTLNEIVFLSKISEQEAAGFNFTLDESYLVKLHVIDKIVELRAGYAKFIERDISGTKQIFSITHLNSILGDLHFFDQEYNDAIIAYSDAIRPIDGRAIEKMDIPDFITIVKTKLKIGLCFEKINSFDEASAQYSECSRDAAKFTLGFKTEIANITEIQKGNIERTYNPLLIRELLQIIVQSVLAKIIIKEKMRFTGARDLSGSIVVFLQMVNDIHKERGYNNLLIKANLFLHLGNLLYYKNSAGVSLGELTDKQVKPDDFYIKMKVLRDRLDKVFYANQPAADIDLSGRKPVYALYMYIIGLCETFASKNIFKEDPDLAKTAIAVSQAENGKKADNTKGKNKKEFETNDGLFNSIWDNDNIVGKLLEKINTKTIKEHTGLRGWDHRYIASFLSNIGDSLLGMFDTPQSKYGKIKIDELCKRADVLKFSEGEGSRDFTSYLNSGDQFGLADVLKCYYLSGEFFLKHGRDVSCSFQFRKILHVLRLVIDPAELKSTELERKFIELVDSLLVKQTLKIISDNSGNTDTHMVEKAENQGVTRAFSLNNISNHPESREVILLFNFVKIKLRAFDIDNDLKISGVPNLINENNSIATQYSRIMELDFNAKYTYEQIVEKSRGNDHLKGISYKQLVVTYVYSVLSMIRILDIYTLDYLIGYRFCAYTHYNLARFLNGDAYKHHITNDVKENINYLLGEGSWASLIPDYHFKIAKGLFEKAIRLHTAGTEYKNMISDMIYLEDDFNDNAYHFGAALDRYLIVNGALNERIKKCVGYIEDDRRAPVNFL